MEFINSAKPFHRRQLSMCCTDRSMATLHLSLLSILPGQRHCLVLLHATVHLLLGTTSIGKLGITSIGRLQHCGGAATKGTRRKHSSHAILVL